MSSKKTHPELVNPAIARFAIGKAKLRTECYTQYIVLHFRQTGNLAPGCDNRDLLAWYEQNMPDELKAITKLPARGHTRAERK